MPKLLTVYNLGMDALKSMFYLQWDPSFSFFAEQVLTQDELMIRVPSISIPEDGMSTYQINHLAHVFDRPGGKIEMNKNISLTMRVDQNFRIYQAFKNWKDSILNSQTGVIGDITSGLTNCLIVYTVKSH
jgi:hypothetical protein